MTDCIKQMCVQAETELTPVNNFNAVIWTRFWTKLSIVSGCILTNIFVFLRLLVLSLPQLLLQELAKQKFGSWLLCSCAKSASWFIVVFENSRRKLSGQDCLRGFSWIVTNETHSCFFFFSSLTVKSRTAQQAKMKWVVNIVFYILQVGEHGRTEIPRPWINTGMSKESMKWMIVVWFWFAQAALMISLIWKFYSDPVTVVPSKWIAPVERLVAFPTGVAGKG